MDSDSDSKPNGVADTIASCEQSLDRLDLLFSGPPKIKDPSLLKEPIFVDEGEDLVMKVPYSGRPKPKVSLFLQKYQILILNIMVYSHWPEPRPGQRPETNGLCETVWKLSHYT